VNEKYRPTHAKDIEYKTGAVSIVFQALQRQVFFGQEEGVAIEVSAARTWV
jgi:hypothetical protein